MRAKCDLCDCDTVRQAGLSASETADLLGFYTQQALYRTVEKNKKLYFKWQRFVDVKEENDQTGSR